MFGFYYLGGFCFSSFLYLFFWLGILPIASVIFFDDAESCLSQGVKSPTSVHLSVTMYAHQVLMALQTSHGAS